MSKPMNNTEREGIEEQVIRLHEAIEKYRTELILKKVKKFSLKFKEVIKHYYAERKMAVIEELAAVNKPLILATIQEELVLRWLPADNSDDAYAVDPNDVRDRTYISYTNIICLCIHVYFFFHSYFRVNIIVHLLKLIDMTQVMMHLVTLLRKDASTVSGGYKTIIRAACVLLRAYNDKQLEKVKYNHLKIWLHFQTLNSFFSLKLFESSISELEAILYGRLLEMARVDIPLDNFRKQDKHAVARGLASPGTRWTPELAYLVACLVIDYEIKDRVMVDVLLNRLQAAQKKEIYVALLNWCRQEKSLHRVKNLPLLWARAFDWSLASVDVDEADVHALVQHWFYFAISCPVEGGRAFDSISNALKGRGYPIAAYLISVVGAYTQKCPVFDFSSINSEQELLFGWMSNEINVEDMETNV
uniref:Rab-GAP TBC domain-containing protein n=1 Tax=Heterorhabditis bacteriophora TaxID=37862 RepID=A0A1I7WWD7_HETBA